MSYPYHSASPPFWGVGDQQTHDYLQQQVMEHHQSSISPEGFQQQLSPVESAISTEHYGTPHHPQQPLPPTPVYQTPQTIELQLHEPLPQGQLHFDNINETHFQQENTENRRRVSSGRAASRTGDETRSSTSPSSRGAGPSRVPHGKTHAQSHPYSRPSTTSPTARATSSRNSGARASSSSARAQPQESETLGERSTRLHRSVPPTPTVESSLVSSCPTSALHSWRVPLPMHSSESVDQQVAGSRASAAPNVRVPSLEAQAAALEDLATSPTASNLPIRVIPPGPASFVQPEPENRLRIRMDVVDNGATRERTIVMEVPGLKKDDLDIFLRLHCDCRQLVVLGHDRSSRLEGDYVLQERKSGKSIRVLNVPLGTQPDDVTAILEDGLLIMKHPRGPSPPEHEQLQRIRIQ